MGIVPNASLAGIDVVTERDLTPGCRNRHHLNAAGAALPTGAVVETVVEHLRLEQSEGGYEAEKRVVERIEAVYASAARLVGASPEEIALFDSATGGLRAVVDALVLKPGQRLLLSRSTYVSHAMHLLALSRRHGLELVVLPNGTDGAVDLGVLEGLLAEGRNDVVCLAHVPTSSGLVEPAELVGALVARHGGVYILDATQSVGQIDIDVRRIGCHALAATGRKFLRAPRGTGFTYIAAPLLDALLPVAPDVRGSVWVAEREVAVGRTARKLETWESAVACRLGLGVALDEALSRGTAATQTHLSALAHRLRAELSSIERVALADPPAATSAIVTFRIDGMDQQQVGKALSAAGVRLLVVPRSHAQFDLGARRLESVVRVSPHVYTDEDDAGSFLQRVADLAAAPLPV